MTTTSAVASNCERCGGRMVKEETDRVCINCGKRLVEVYGRGYAELPLPTLTEAIIEAALRRQATHHRRRLG